MTRHDVGLIYSELAPRIQSPKEKNPNFLFNNHQKLVFMLLALDNARAGNRFFWERKGLAKIKLGLNTDTFLPY